MDDNNRRDDKDKKEDVILEADQKGARLQDEVLDKGGEVTPEIDPVQEELEQVKALVTQLENNYKRALADYQNLQRRTQEEKVEWIKMASKDFVLKFLPVFDTLILAQNHLQDKGLALSVDQFIRVLADEGIVKIETIGKEFDPTTMEVVTTKEADKKETGKVIEETRAGFMYHETVLRPAQVIVGE